MSRTESKFKYAIQLKDNNTGPNAVGDLSGVLTSADNGAIYHYQNALKAFLNGSETELGTTTTTQTLSNKTLTGNIAVNLVSGAATITLPTTTSTLATLALAETLTNKTLTSPAINTANINSGTASNSSRIILPSNSTTNLAGLTNTAGLIAYDSTQNLPVYNNGSGFLTIGQGTVTSIALTVPSFLSVSGSPITSSGTLAVTLSGTALPILNGGTGQTTALAAFNALSPMTTGGDLIYGGASGSALRLANGTAGYLLQSNGTTLAPTWVPAPTTSPLTTKGDLFGYSTVNARIPVGSDGQVVIADSNNTNGVRYQDLVLKNYIINSDAEVDTSGWATYFNTAANIPSTGTSGTATNLTFSRSTSSPLRGLGSFSLVQANSTSLQGKGVAYAFTIDSADQAKPLAITFDYNASSTFVVGNGITAPLNDGTTTTNAGNSDIEIFIYDVTNSVLIPVSPQVITANGSNNFSFKAIFQTASNSTSYRLIFHVATTSANATGWTFKFDKVFVGAQNVSYGYAGNDSISYTPTYVGFGTVTNNQTYYRRNGEYLEVQGSATTGISSANSASIQLPSNLAIDYTKISTQSAGSKVGDFMYTVPSTSTVLSTLQQTVSYLFVDGSTTNTVYIAQNTASNVFTKINGSSFLDNSQPFTFNFRVPIVGWSSNVIMSNDTDTRVVAFQGNSTAATTLTAGVNTIIPFTAQKDTHGGWSTNTYTIPVSGYYRVAASAYVSSAAWTQTDGLRLILFQNGSEVLSLAKMNIPTTGTYQTSVSGPGTIFANAGDTLSIKVNANRTGGNSTLDNSQTASGTGNYFHIERISGPAAIAATESVNARYGGSTTVIGATNTDVTLIQPTKSFDSHNAYNTSTGIYTIPVSGKYSVTGALQGAASIATGAALDPFYIRIQKNSTDIASNAVFTQSSSLTALPIVQVTDVINCVAGDTINIAGVNDWNASSTLSGSTVQNYFAIYRVGN